MATGARQKSRDTLIELRFRKELRALGLKGYRLHHKINLPHWGKKSQRTTPDVAFVTDMLAIYLDGCYWHGCPVCPPPKVNGEWRRKQALTRARDERHSRYLVSAGWRVLRVWEHQDMAKAATAAKAILDTDQPPGVFAVP